MSTDIKLLVYVTDLQKPTIYTQLQETQNNNIYFTKVELQF